MDKLTQLSRSNNLCEQESEYSDRYLDTLESEEDWSIAPIRVGQEHDRLIDDVFQGALINSFAVHAKTARLFDWTEFVLLFSVLTLLGSTVGCQSVTSSQFTSHSQKTEYQFRAQNTPTSQKKKGILTPVVDFFRKDEDDVIANSPSSAQPVDPGISPNSLSHPNPIAPPDFTPSQIFANRSKPYPLGIPNQPLQYRIPSQSGYVVPTVQSNSPIPPSSSLLSHQQSQVALATEQTSRNSASQPFQASQLQSPQPNQLVVQPTTHKSDLNNKSATFSTNLHPDLVALINDLKEAENVHWGVAGPILEELKTVDSKIPGYSFLVQRTRFELLGEKAAHHVVGTVAEDVPGKAVDRVDRSLVSTDNQPSAENKRQALSVERANTLNKSEQQELTGPTKQSRQVGQSGQNRQAGESEQAGQRVADSRSIERRNKDGLESASLDSEQVREPAPVPTLTPLTPKKEQTRLAKLREVVRNEKDLPISTVSESPVSQKTDRLAELPKDTMFVPQGHFAPLLDDLESTGTSKSEMDSGSQKKEGQDNQQRIGESENPTRQVAYQSNAFVQTPNELQSAEDWERSLRQTIDSLKTRINLSTNRDSVIQDELRLRLLTLTLGDQRESQQPISGLDEHFQGFYSNELFGLATLLDERTTPDVSTRCIMAQPHFQEAQEQLQHFCPLRMRNLQFIKNDWRGFGGYSPMKGEFQPDDYPLIYLELENVAVGGNAAIGYNTKMSFSYEILDGNGATVSKSDNMLCEEVSRSRRKDISWTIPIELPNSLSPGHYFVLIRAVDQNHLRLQMDTQRLGFMITPIRTPTSSQ
ncbi:MAG: hypothetical protein ACRC10_09355 [Thermoguttaceae bacterium]